MTEKVQTPHAAASRIYDAWFCAMTPRLVAREPAGPWTHIADEGERSVLVQQCYTVLTVQRAAYDRDVKAGRV